MHSFSASLISSVVHSSGAEGGVVGLELGGVVAVTTDCGEPVAALPSPSDIGEVWSFGCAADDGLCGLDRVSSGG